MDMKQIFSKLAKQQFWIVTGFSVILATVGFFMARSEISTLYSAQETTLKTHYTNLDEVRSAAGTHPNSHSEEQMDLIIGSLEEDVRSAWEMQYQRQAAFLVWPTEAIKSPRLVKKLEKYMPLEFNESLVYPAEPNDITDVDKRTYNNYFDGQMTRLAAIIGVEWVGEATAGGGGMGGYGMGGGGYGGDMGGYGGGYGGEGGGYGGEGGGMGGYGGGYGGEGGYGGMGGMGGYGGMGGGLGAVMSNKKRDLVTWSKTSQSQLLTEIKLWTGELPTVYEIVYTQENMWILEGLLNIIAKTNGKVTSNFQCAIKEIEYIRIGKPARGKAGSIDSPAGGAGGYGASMGGDGGGYGPGSYGGEGGGYGGESGYGGGGYGGAPDYGGGMGDGYGGEDGGYGGYGGGGAVSRDPADNRYVDANFQPITGEDLRTRMTSGDAADAFFAVAKRVPVRLRFKMDQRKIQTFIANCGNADLMLEVRQVRIGDTTPAGSASAGGMGGYGMGGGGYGGGPSEGMGAGMGDDGLGGYGGGYGGEGGGYGGEGGYGGMGMGGGAGMALAKDPFDLDVEVYGVVNLYNPVNMESLGIEDIDADTEMNDLVDPEQATEADAPPANAGGTPPGPEDQGPGNQGPGNQGPGNQGPGNQGPGNQGPGNQGPGNQGPGNQGPGNQGPGNQGPGNQGPAGRPGGQPRGPQNPSGPPPAGNPQPGSGSGPQPGS